MGKLKSLTRTRYGQGCKLGSGYELSPCGHYPMPIATVHADKINWCMHAVVVKLYCFSISNQYALCKNVHYLATYIATDMV